MSETDKASHRVSSKPNHTAKHNRTAAAADPGRRCRSRWGRCRSWISPSCIDQPIRHGIDRGDDVAHRSYRSLQVLDSDHMRRVQRALLDVHTEKVAGRRAVDAELNLLDACLEQLKNRPQG